MESTSSAYRLGDIIVGSSDPNKSIYSATGQKIAQDGVEIYGNPKDIKKISEELTRSMMRHGGELLPQRQEKPKKTVSRKGIKKKSNSSFSGMMSRPSLNDVSYEPEYIEPLKETPVVLETVQFENSFGNIKAKVEHLVESELAFMLIFTDEDAMVFEPRIGETLVLRKPNRQKQEVYYPGVTFDMPETSKKLMILFKVPETTEE
jgi:hypothetical protein